MKRGIDSLQHPLFLLVLGDQVAAGQDATGLNTVGGKGYARLLLNNHPDFPAWEGQDLATRFPGLALVDFARDGATTTRARANLERGLANKVIPPFIEGDLVVLIHAGGNDFFADPSVALDEEATQAAASVMRSQLAIMISLLRMRYEKANHAVVVLVGNIIDPTDGTGMVPEDFQVGASEALSSLVVEDDREQMLANLEYMNHELAKEVARRGAWLVDAHAAFLGHGLTADDDERWLAPDGQKLLDAGHDALRRVAWKVLTGEDPVGSADSAA